MNTGTETWNRRHRQQTQWILDGAAGRPIRFALESNNENHEPDAYRYESFNILSKGRHSPIRHDERDLVLRLLLSAHTCEQAVTRWLDGYRRQLQST